LQRAIFVPEDDIAFYLFQAPSAAAARDAMTRARLQSDRITEAVSTEARPTRFSRRDERMTHALNQAQLFFGGGNGSPVRTLTTSIGGSKC
jgi:hypothetical protein